MRFATSASILAASFSLVLLTGCGGGQEASTAPETPPSAPVYDLENAVWPQDASDLMPDPDVTYGQLENGMRYIIMANDTPEETVALRLRVGAGSLNERDDQRGISHFLEHLSLIHI